MVRKEFLCFSISFLFLFVQSTFADVSVNVRHYEVSPKGAVKLKDVEHYLFSEESYRKGCEGLQKMLVADVWYDGSLILTNGERVKLLGADYVNHFAIRDYLGFLKRRPVWLAFDGQLIDARGRILAYVFTEDKIFLNAYMIQQGWALADDRYPCRFYKMFKSYERPLR